MRKVTIVVPVLITSCQVSEKRKSGPSGRPDDDDECGSSHRPGRSGPPRDLIGAVPKAIAEARRFRRSLPA